MGELSCLSFLDGQSIHGTDTERVGDVGVWRAGINPAVEDSDHVIVFSLIPFSSTASFAELYIYIYIGLVMDR